MSSDDPDGQFDEIFSSTVDKNIQRSDEESPLISSGVSSKGSKDSPAIPVEDAGKVIMKCPRVECKKTYKTDIGLKNHLFVHRMQDVNQSKPTEDDVFLHMNSFVNQVLEEMMQEPNSASEKLNTVGNMIKGKDSQEWFYLVSCLSGLISGSLAKRTKLLPKNQYQEFQTQIITALNDDEKFYELKNVLSHLCQSDKELPYSSNILFRLCIRIGELVQSYLISKMKQVKDSDEAFFPVMSEEEQVGFKFHLRKFFQNYYLRAVSLNNEVWKARSLCIRNRFVINTGGEPVGSQDVLDNIKWDDKQLDISESALTFFKGIEIIIRSVHQTTGSYGLDNVLNTLIDNADLLNAFHFLVTGYLGETDTISFLREMVQLFYSLSLRKEEKRIMQSEESKQSLAKISLRQDLSRNVQSKKEVCLASVAQSQTEISDPKVTKPKRSNVNVTLGPKPGPSEEKNTSVENPVVGTSKAKCVKRALSATGKPKKTKSRAGKK
ncbi:Potassium-transporting ATPase potassium-binding subunit [Frankliniella fusca]|uniref:Potassium-transporting ATPase potassium-binding subunit n=1 Tax=Frankliniella fusca TaxID=407009 RepID=A0AAE1L6Z7_9NEOP|nr:Potassium-transporting ATPase potassium-binding subunit [Frankliniella fusca]